MIMAVTKKIGTKIDHLQNIRLKLDEVDVEIKKHEVKKQKIKEKYVDKEDEIWNSFTKEELDGAFGKTASVEIKREIFPSVKDWPKFYTYIAKNKAWDMLQKRTSSTAYRDRLKDGKKIPGVEKFTKVTLKLKAKKK